MQEVKTSQPKHILPLCCFPSVSWLKLNGDSAIIDVHENYVKQSFRNRFDIVGVNGLITLTIPVQGQKGEKIPFKEIVLSEGSWRKQHIRSIKSAYGRSAYFEHFFPELEKIFGSNQRYLFDFNLNAIEWMKQNGIKQDFNFSNGYVEADTLSDHRKAFEPSDQRPDFKSYFQVFSDRQSFIPNLSSIDLMMNLGPQANDYLASLL